MNKLLEELADILGWVAFIGLIVAAAWVFGGEPDLWDKWHGQAMQGACKQETRHAVE